MQALRTTGAVLGGVVLDVVRLLLRHGPVLAAVLFAGIGLHDLVVDGATRLSVADGTAGLLVLMWAPMCVLVACVLGLRAVAPSLRGQAGRRPASRSDQVAGDAGGGRVRRTLRAVAALLADLGSLVLPFVAAYELAGFVREDARTYAYQIALDQTSAIYAGQADGARANGTARLGLTSPAALAVVVVSALVVRWSLVRLGARDRRPWLIFPAAYVEVVWLTLVMSAALNQGRTFAEEWVLQRRVSVWVQTGWSAFLDVFGPLAPLARTVATWVTDGLTSVDRVLLLPLGWLTVAAVVLGRRIGEHAEEEQREAGELSRVARMRRGLAGRFEGLVVAVRHLRHLGVLPGIAYCVGFLLVWSSETWLWELERLFVGPRPLQTWFALNGPLSNVNRALSLMLVVAYVAVCADRALGGTDEPADRATSQPAPVTPSADPPADAPPRTAAASTAR